MTKRDSASWYFRVVMLIWVLFSFTACGSAIWLYSELSSTQLQLKTWVELAAKQVARNNVAMGVSEEIGEGLSLESASRGTVTIQESKEIRRNFIAAYNETVRSLAKTNPVGSRLKSAQ